MTMIKVTFCAYDKPDNVGGPVSWLQRLAPELKKRGFEVRCLFIMHWGSRGPALDALQAAGIDCVVATGLDTTEERIAWILDELRKNPPDVFVPNLVVAAYLASKWVREAGIPTVGILHSDDPFYRAIEREFVTGKETFRVSTIVCVSEHLESQLRVAAPHGVEVERIPYGVAIPGEQVQRNPGALRLCYVGRLAEEQKRIGDVVRSLIRATSEVENTNAVIYGDGPDRPVVQRVLEEASVRHSVFLAGSIDSAEIQQRLLQSDAIVLLSDYEGLPIALLEAMACGCVPICSAMSSGIPELIENERTGLIVEDRGDAFVRAVERLRYDADLWHTISNNARDLVVRRYSESSSLSAWSSLFQRLGDNSRPTRAVARPRKLRLPAVNPALASADVRKPKVSVARQAYLNARMFAGLMRRRWRGRASGTDSRNQHSIVTNTTIARISGGLANQMLCYKLGRYVADLKNSKLILDASPYDPATAPARDFQLSNYDLACDAIVLSERDTIELRARSKAAELPKEMLDDKTPAGRDRIIEFIRKNDVIYCDLWLALRLRTEADAYAESSNVLRELSLDPDKSFDAADHSILQAIRRADNPVAIHVRRGDFATHDGNLLLTRAYYNTAMKQMKGQLEAPSFFVFSDDIAWCRANLETASDIHFVDFHDDASGYKDMYLASQCRHFILSNESTFSHQIVQLSENFPGRIVLTSSFTDLARNAAK